MSSETGRGIIKAGNALRFLYRYGVNGPAILQQAWSDVDTGEIHWRDVPYFTEPPPDNWYEPADGRRLAEHNKGK